MEVQNAFEVARDQAAVWELLMDVPRVVPCLPGATLLETVDEDRWKAELVVKLGPVAMTFESDVHREHADRDAGEVRLSVKARERGGRGAANAEIRSALSPTADGTRVSITTAMRLQGPVARIGRGDIVEEVSQQMVDAFAGCLEGKLTGTLDRDEVAPAPSAIRLLLRAWRARLRRIVRRR